MANPVTDPELLAALNGPEPKGKVTDPALLATLEGTAHPLVAAHTDMSAEPKSTLQTIREAIHAPTRALENGYFMGLGDRARALIDTAISGGSHPLTGLITGDDGSYSSNLRKEQGDTEQFAKDHPVASPALEAVGGVAGPAGVIGAAAKGATLGVKTLIGAGTGLAVGAGQGAAGSKDWTDLPQVGKDAAFGGGVGLGLGILLPGASKIIGAGYEKAANLFSGKVDGMSRAAGAHLIRGVEADGPAAVQARLAELGPDAMLADAGPALLGKAQGASLNSDEGRSVLQGALTTRNTGTNARVQSDVNHAMGPAEDPQTVTDAVIAHRTAVDSVNYPAALNAAPDVQTAHILTELDHMIPRSVGMENKALTNLRDMMMTTERRPRVDPYTGRQAVDSRGNMIFDEVPVSQNDAGVLHKVKGELDNVIEHDQPGLGVPAGAVKNQQAALKQMRFRVNQALQDQVPGYEVANRVSQALANRADAVKLGTQYLGSGKTIPSPERFAAAFDPLSQGEKIALAKGSRGVIDHALGVKANDLQALRGELQGEGGWNTAKLATVHGQPAAQGLMDSVDRNLKFRDTYNKVVENSQTAQRNAAAKDMKPDPSSETPFFGPSSTFAGMGVTAAKKGVSAVANALLKSDPTRHYGEVARALTEQGAKRDARLAAVVSALNSRQGNAASAPMVGNTGAVVAALLGNAALDRHSPAKARQ
jgi:hypothetical protein